MPDTDDSQNQEQEGLSQGGAGKKSRFASVRDSLASGASRLKNAVGSKLEKAGDEQSLAKLRVEKPEVIEQYEKRKKELDDLKKEKPQLMADKNASIDAALGDVDANEKVKYGENYLEIKAREQELAEMRQENPGLKQLERGKVGQVVHSKIRDAAKAVGSRLKT